MAIIRQESSFDPNAAPERNKLLGFIPWKRPSSAKGYAQAVEGTWEEYKKETNNRRAKRSNFSDSVEDISHRIEESLLDLTTNLSFIDLEDVIGYLEVIYKNELFLENSLGKKKSYDDFAISKEIIDSVETFLSLIHI